MLSALHIKHYVLIDSLDVSFPEGLVIITGQTGAGKSILLGALSLLTGVKADASVISEGADTCVVEGEFGIPEGDGAVLSLLEENGVEWDGGHLLVRRVVHASGRSRCFVNDCPVQVGVLSALSARLVDIHSQHQSLLLTDRPFQLATLDQFAGNAALLADCREAFRRVNALSSELAELETRLERLSAEKAYNEARYAQLEAARLRDGELAELEAEQRQLAHAEQIKEHLSAVEALFAGSDERSLAASLKEAGRLLQKVRDFVPAVGDAAQRLESARLEIEDISETVSDTNASISLSGERLAAVEERMSLLYELMRKFSCGTESELIAERGRLSEALYDSTALDERRLGLRQELKAAQAALDVVAGRLHDARAKAAPAFAAEIERSIHYLELDHAVFVVDLEDAPLGATGRDAVAFRFSATGKSPVDVARCASGGELSRIMLCLKALKARYTQMPVMVFDEIDTGVSGSVADKMGSMICAMGDTMQVFAITHLPQVAAKGRAHYLVTRNEGDRTTSTVRLLDTQERILELARMLSGSSVTEAAIENAKSLLFQ